MQPTDGSAHASWVEIYIFQYNAHGGRGVGGGEGRRLGPCELLDGAGVDVIFYLY